MRSWHIEWTQTTDGKEKHFTDVFIAKTPDFALAQWAMHLHANAQIDAVYDPLKFGSERRAPIGETAGFTPCATYSKKALRICGSDPPWVPSTGLTW